MKIILVGANGTIGKHIDKLLKDEGNEVVRVGRKTGEVSMNMEDPTDVSQFYRKNRSL